MPNEVVLATRIDNFAAIAKTIDASSAPSTRLAYDSAHRGFTAYYAEQGMVPGAGERAPPRPPRHAVEDSLADTTFAGVKTVA